MSQRGEKARAAQEHALPCHQPERERVSVFCGLNRPSDFPTIGPTTKIYIPKAIPHPQEQGKEKDL